MGKKLNIGNNSKINVRWEVSSLDYTKEKENIIKEKFSKKYNIKKENVTVDVLFKKEDLDDKNLYTTDIVNNIQDPLFQQELFKKYIDAYNVEDYNFDKIIEIDNLINSNIDYEIYSANKSFSLKWIKWNNFMSYGENNFFDFTKLSGLVLLTSEPANQGGKTTFCLDLFRFLLFGKVTSRESDWTLSKVFNKYYPEKNECIVEGCIEINGEDFIIKRTVTRPALKKRSEKSKVTQKIDYYKLINNDEIELEDFDNQQEDSVKNTNKVIKDAIGNEKDFDLMICVNSDNLKGLISLKDTERGRLITRWVGLLPIEEKDKIARETFNKVVSPKLLMNKYNSEELANSNEELLKDNANCDKEIEKLEKNKADEIRKLDEYNKIKENLLLSKTKIDDSLSKVDIKSVENQLSDIKDRGTRKREEKKSNEEKLGNISCFEFDENNYRELENKCLELNSEIATMRQQIVFLKKEITTLENSEYCPTCGAKLKNVDNTEKISEKKQEYVKLANEGKNKKDLYDSLLKEKDLLSKKREEYNEGIRLKLIIEKNEVDIENLINKYRELNHLLKDIESNKEAIENNNNIDNSLNIVNVNINNTTNYINNITTRINEYKAQIAYNTKQINLNYDLISQLKEEEVLVKNWKLYLDMIGKNGISKLVLRNVLPFINIELKRLLNDVCDFYVEVSIDDHNDVAFSIVHDDVSSNLASGSGFEQTVASLALRSVLSKVSTFSKPSFVVFDEILGGVSDENYDEVKKLYDKIVSDYNFIFQITHLKQIADWHNQTVIVRKENNISSISMM